MAEPTAVTASAVNKASSGDAVILVPTLHPVRRYPSMVLIALVWFWKGFIKFLINIAVPSTFVPTNKQRLKAAIATRQEIQKALISRASTSDIPIAAREPVQSDHGRSRRSSNHSLRTLVDPGSPIYSLLLNRSRLGTSKITDNGNDFELPPLEYVPPTPEDIKRWVGLSFEERRKIDDMSVNGLNWMEWDTAKQPLPSTRVRGLPKGIPEWSEEWSCYDLPEDPEYVPTSDNLRRWWGEATEDDRARINRICVEGLNWRR
ncbi:hypothetical protein B0T20DRAFT_396967 [Sordaria brevicollis]|uniref:Uncharacterized protein n=1 Tax=Sordaria brevicollis TaxID=83679 RepID=A0AAE0U5B3_SORBR|nr:hypothetical protein B0T20DRAFT_396967 [Sordaria brevicollis]